MNFDISSADYVLVISLLLVKIHRLEGLLTSDQRLLLYISFTEKNISLSAFYLVVRNLSIGSFVAAGKWHTFNGEGK